jgi:hypothetical protein
MSDAGMMRNSGLQIGDLRLRINRLEPKIRNRGIRNGEPLTKFNPAEPRQAGAIFNIFTITYSTLSYEERPPSRISDQNLLHYAPFNGRTV